MALLKDIADVQTGPFGSQLHKEDYVLDGTPIVTVEHLGKRVFTEQNLPRVSDKDKERLSKYVLEVGDTVFSRVGSVDRCSYVDEVHSGWMFSGRCLRVRPNKNIDPEYLYYFFTTENTKQLIRNIAVGATMPSINTKILSEINVPIPDIETQKKIAGILAVIDKKIENNEAINKNLEDQALTIYRKMFIEIGNDNRDTCRTDEFFDITIGKTPPRKEKEWFSDNPEDYVWVSISNMGNCGMFINDSSEYLTRAAVDKYNVKVIPSNTVILSFKLTVGRIAITVGEITTNEAIAHFNTNRDNIVEYLYCYLKAFDFDALGSTSSIGTAVNSKTIKGMDFIVPEENELEEFYEIANPMFQQIKKNQFETQKLVAMRDLLLQRLMSGELDVSGLDL